MKATSHAAVSIAVPNKGRLSESVVDLFRRAGLAIELGGSRELIARAWGGRIRVLFVRAQDIPGFVADGRVDLGVTGLDLVLEDGADVKRLVDLRFGACRLVMAVPQRRGITALKDLPPGFAVATSFPNLTRKFLKKKGLRGKIIPVSGATEVMPHIGVADVVTDLTATGSTLAMNELVEIASIVDSTAWLIAYPPAVKDSAKKDTIAEFQFALRSVVEARAKRYLMMDVPTKALEEVRRIAPGIAGPTVMDLAGNPRMKAVHVVVDEKHIYETMLKLKALGARGILVVPIDRMVT